MGSTSRSSIMTDISRKLTDTARALLTAAAMRNDHLIALPKLPVAAARQVVRSLLNAGFAEEVPAAISNPGYAWRAGEDGDVLVLRATALGIDRVSDGGADVSLVPLGTVADDSAGRTGAQAGGSPSIGPASTVDPFADGPALTEGTKEGADAPDRAVTAPTPTLPAEVPEAASKRARPPGAGGLPRAAQALLDAWDRPTEGGSAYVAQIIGPIAALRAALAASASAHQPDHRAKPRPDTKQAQVLAMLARDEGASGPQIADAMGWAPHTVRGFLAGLVKKGIRVEVLERVRQVGPNKSSAKGSYTVYRLAAEVEVR
jgi:hypothetical protein